MVLVLDYSKVVCELKVERGRAAGATALRNKTCCFLLMAWLVNCDNLLFFWRGTVLNSDDLKLMGYDLSSSAAWLYKHRYAGWTRHFQLPPSLTGRLLTKSLQAAGFLL